MSQKSSVPQAISFVSQVLKRDMALIGRGVVALFLVVTPTDTKTVGPSPLWDHPPLTAC